MAVTRPIALDDAATLAALFRDNREFLTPYMPAWEDWMFTEEGQRRAVAEYLARQRVGSHHPRVILGEEGAVVGRVNLNDIVRGVAQSCHLGYWLAESATGRGLATRAVHEMVDLAFGELGLHRIQAGTLVDNVASQRVLAHNGFERIGLAPGYVKIDGRWQDHLLFQRLAGDGRDV